MATQSRLPTFLLTRPLAQSERFATQLRARFGVDVQVVISPLMDTGFLTPAFPDPRPSALIFTSETGVAGFVQHPDRPADLPQTAYCVGNRTAQAAKAAGLKPISADGDATALIALIAQSGVPGPLLHLCGQQTRGDIAGQLTDAGHPTTALVLYEQRPKSFTPQALSLLSGKRPVVVPLFSPRSAALFLAQLAQTPVQAPLVYAALSQAVAAPLTAQEGAACIAAKPTADALIDALVCFFAAV